ncbi:hypothetical protein [Saccharospirillum sp. MSK14-1]|uniref:hypothetical protein n=1 Tax=Saccharospirillum sp. MSK14-1 TaxID=1897632 RepID=UPI001304DF42
MRLSTLISGSETAFPDLIRPFNCKRPIQVIGDIRSFNRGLFVGVRSGLLTDQPQLTNQPYNLETTDDNDSITEQAFDGPVARRAATLGEQAIDQSLQGQALDIHMVSPVAILAIAGTIDTKRFTDHFVDVCFLNRSFSESDSFHPTSKVR